MKDAKKAKLYHAALEIGKGLARWPKARRSSGLAIAAEALMNNAGKGRSFTTSRPPKKSASRVLDTREA